MGILAKRVDERITDVDVSEKPLTVYLKDGRIIAVPLDWYPRLKKANEIARPHWEICEGGYGIHWPDIDEDLSIKGMLRSSSLDKQKHVSY
jgi:hypothetical protein